MLKHIIRHHLKESEPTEFRMKVISSHYSAFNRQISEAVLIKKNEGKYLLNSKAEYNRCSLPSIRTNERKSEWELSEMLDDEFEAGISYIKKYRKENLMPNIEIITRKKSEKNVKVKLVEKENVKESTEKKLLDECENIMKWNSNRWEVRENTERVKRLEEQAKLDKEYRLSRAKILKENFLKKQSMKNPKKEVKWSKEKLEFRKNSWRKYREVRSTIDVHERLGLIEKLMVNIPERKLRTEHEFERGKCDSLVLDGDKVTELSPASPFSYSVIDRPNSDIGKTEQRTAYSLSRSWLNSDLKTAESSPACSIKSFVKNTETELTQPQNSSLCPNGRFNCDVSVGDDVIRDNFKILSTDGVIGGLRILRLNIKNKGIKSDDIEVNNVNDKVAKVQTETDELGHENLIHKHKNFLDFECVRQDHSDDHLNSRSYSDPIYEVSLSVETFSQSDSKPIDIVSLSVDDLSLPEANGSDKLSVAASTCNDGQSVIEKENHREKVTSTEQFELVKNSVKNEEIRTESDSLGIVEKIKISLIESMNMKGF